MTGPDMSRQLWRCMVLRDRPSCFDQVGHQTTYALMRLMEISSFSLNNVIARPNKIMNNLLKDCKIRTFKVIL